MKDERNVRHRRAAGGKWQPVAIILAAVLMVLSVPLGGRAALAADPTGPVDVKYQVLTEGEYWDNPSGRR